MKSIKVLALLMLSNSSLAAVIDITAVYKPESYEVSGGRFINTTQCDIGRPIAYCDPQKPQESAVIVKLPVSITKTINSTQGKQSYSSYYRISGPKKVTLTNSVNGEQHELTFIPTNIGAKLIGMQYPIINGDKYPMGNIGGDCYTNQLVWSWWTDGLVTGQLFLYFIKDAIQNSASECYFNSGIGNGTSYKFDWVNYGFRMKTPNPLKMSNGKYVGSLKVTVGRNKDIDLGDATYSGGGEHELKFTLTVRHQLKVDFPRGEGEGHANFNLLPPSGWNNWINKGNRVPSVLQQELSFRLWCSAPYTVTLRCQYTSGTECALKNAKGHQAKLNTYYINLENEIINLSTKPYRFTPLWGPVINGARKIKFSVAGDVVTEMMKYPGTTYKGDVTLIFDAAID
ncbi:TPA: hypothetical protein ACNV64_000911 [Aeromonas salmonicida subsp. pectinolytica]